jgi:tetratricopeptide (TPR) repeat protein
MKRVKPWLFRLAPFLAIVILLPLAGEIALRILQPQTLALPRERDPTGLPYLKKIKEQGQTYYTPTPVFRDWGHNFKFQAPKPKGVYRIFVLGDSTANGHAFGNAGAFPAWLTIMLRAADPWTSYEVINMAQSGFPASEMLWLLRQVIFAHPDLVIIYASNNEFFYRRGKEDYTRSPDAVLQLRHHLMSSWLVRLVVRPFYREAGSTVPRFELGPRAIRLHAAGFLAREAAEGDDQEIVALVLERQRRNVAAMVDLAHEHGAQVMVCLLPVNYRDWTPSGSHFRPGLGASQRAEYDRLVAEGKKFYAASNFSAAQQSWLAAYEINNISAELNFLLGHACLRVGERERAWEYFQLAVINDVNRSRAGPDQNIILKQEAEKRGAVVVDLITFFRHAAKDSIPGDDLFVDNVHPTLEGQRVIAEAILETMIAAELVLPGPHWRSAARQAAEKYYLRFPREYLFRSYYTWASLNAFQGRFRQARFWTAYALGYDPGNAEGNRLKECLDRIMMDYPGDTAWPWGEIEFASAYP